MQKSSYFILKVVLLLMNTNTIVKVRRKRGADPAFSFVLASKRIKTNEESFIESNTSLGGVNNVEKTVFHFVTTIDEKSDVSNQVTSRVQEAIASCSKKVGSELLPIHGTKLDPINVPKCLGNNEQISLLEEEMAPEFLLEKIQEMNKEKCDIACNSVQMFREKLSLNEPSAKEVDGYVYDVYWCQKQNNFVNWKIEDILYLQPYQ